MKQRQVRRMFTRTIPRHRFWPEYVLHNYGVHVDELARRRKRSRRIECVPELVR